MKKIVKIKFESNHDSSLKLKKTCVEFIYWKLVGGGEIYSDFEFNIQPNNQDQEEFVIEIEADNEYQILTIEYGVLKAIHDIRNKYYKRSIDFWGLIIKINNFSFHSVDSKPRGYEIPFKRRIYELIENGSFKKNCTRFSPNCLTFSMSVLDGFDRNKAYHPANSLFLYCPIKNDKTLVFSKDWDCKSMIIDEDYADTILEIDIKIISIYTFTKMRDNKIAISYGKEIEPFIIDSVTNQIREFMNSVYDKGVNLGSLTFYVFSKEKWKNDYSPIRKFNSTGWMLESIISDEANFTLEPVRPIPKIIV